MVAILLYVLLGMLLYAVFIPIIDEIVQIITQWLEIIKGKQVKKMTLLQQEITNLENEISQSETTTDTRVIGFTIPNDEELGQDEEDYD